VANDLRVLYVRKPRLKDWDTTHDRTARPSSIGTVFVRGGQRTTFGRELLARLDNSKVKQLRELERGSGREN